MALGLGSGSTAEIALGLLARRVAAGLRVVGVPTSRRVERLARQRHVPLTTLEERPHLDLTIDGADEIEPRSFALVKGRGGALLREKLVALASAVEIIVADESKLVTALGEREPVPVEVVPFGWKRTAEAVAALGCVPRLRTTRLGRPYITDNRNYILDCHFPPLPNPADLAARLKALPGVVETGIFLNLAHRVVVAGTSGIQIYERASG